MKFSYKTRRLLSLLILLVGLPIYAVLVVTIMSYFSSLPAFIELLIYVFFGVVWVFPLRSIFKGIGQKDPDNSDF